MNVDSVSVIELGTFEHPYKDLNSVFVEVLNLHAHSGRDIVVHIKEHTENYMHVSHNFILNINSLSIMAYSEKYTDTSNKATIISTDKIDVSPVYSMPTSFNILESSELSIQEQISRIEYISSLDKATINNDVSVFMIVNSSFTILNVDIVSDYVNQLSQYYTILANSMDHRLMNITNVDFNVSGNLLSISSSLDIVIQNSMIESTYLMGGIRVRAH